MRQALETIPIWDAFQQDTECPLCILVAQIEDSFLASYLEELVMDASYRSKVVQSGFCNDHLYKLLNRHDNLGLALTLESIIGGMLSSVAKSPVVHLKGGAEGGYQFLRGLFASRGNDGAEKFPADFDLGALLSTPGKCLACKHIDGFLRQHCQLIARMYRDETEFRRVFASSKGFCIPHTFIFVDSLRGIPRSGSHPDSHNSHKEIISDVLRLLRANLERLSGELGWFIKKFDYRFADAPWNGTEDSVERAIQKLAGLPGMHAPIPGMNVPNEYS